MWSQGTARICSDIACAFIVQDDFQVSVVHRLCEGLSFIIPFPGIQGLSQCHEHGLHGTVLSLRYWKKTREGFVNPWLTQGQFTSVLQFTGHKHLVNNYLWSVSLVPGTLVNRVKGGFWDDSFFLRCRANTRVLILSPKPTFKKPGVVALSCNPCASEGALAGQAL